MGIRLSGSSAQISTVDGDIQLTGVADGTDHSNVGVYITSTGAVISSGVGVGAGNIVIEGIGGDGSKNNNGVYVALDSSATSVDGGITVTGHSLISGTEGLVIDGDVSSSGTGTVTLVNDTP